MEVSQVKQYYLKNKAISESVSKSLCFIQKSCNAAAASWAMPSSSNKNLSSQSTMTNLLVLIIITEGRLYNTFLRLFISKQSMNYGTKSK